MTLEEAKNLLRKYQALPQLIEEELAMIRHCEQQKNRIVPPSVNLSGMSTGSGKPSDQTASLALSDTAREYEKEIKACYARIAQLRRQKDLVKQWLDSLDSTDRTILTMKYIGPSERAKRLKWRPATWTEIARKVNYSRSQVFNRVRAVLSRIIIKDWTKLD